MATYTPIEHGKANWDKDLNDNFAKIFGGGVTDDSGWVDCATLVNGAQLYSQLTSGDPEDRGSAVKRRVINFGKQKLVIITGAIGFKSKDEVIIGQTVVQLPEGYKDFWYQANAIIMPGSGKGTVRWALNGPGTEIVISAYNFDDSMTNAIQWFPVRFMYVV